MGESWRHAGRNGAKKKKNEWMKEGCCGEQRRWERETDCQEVEKPADRDHDEGMDSKGLGMACEKTGVGYLFCLLIEIQDARSQPCCSRTGFLFPPLWSPSVLSCSSLFVPSTSSPSLCHVAICIASRCSNPSRSGSGCISMFIHHRNMLYSV